MKRSLGHLGEEARWQDVPDYYLGPFWIGNFCDLRTFDYGDNRFHGRFHPAIPYVAMERFTLPDDIVWDCFAGSGTTLDVGEELDRFVIASDLHPWRNDILRRDATEWNPGYESVDLGIMHPPYFNIINYGCRMSGTDSVKNYIEEFGKCLANMDYALKVGHVLVLVVGEIWYDGELYPLEYDLDNLIRFHYMYRLIGRIVKDFGETKGGNTTKGDKSGNLWKSRLVRFGYFRNGIDTILFYQKVVCKEDVR